MAKELLSVGQVAAELGLTTRTIYRYLESGMLPALRLGPRQYRIERADVEALLTPNGVRG